LLIITGVDADGGLYSLAFAIVKGKQKHHGNGSYHVFIN